MFQRSFIVLTSALLVAGTAGAQYREHERGSDIARVIRDCEDRTSVFERSFRHALERSDYHGSFRQDELNRHADELERAMGKLHETWNRERDVEKTRHFVDEAIRVSRDINHVMNRERFYPGLQDQWAAVRAELNHLAEAFGLPRLRWE